MLHAERMNYSWHMSTIQVRDVPEEVSRELKARAAASGQSLSRYLRDELGEMVRRPSMEQVLERIQSREQVSVSDPVDELRLAREHR